MPHWWWPTELVMCHICSKQFLSRLKESLPRKWDNWDGCDSIIFEVCVWGLPIKMCVAFLLPNEESNLSFILGVPLGNTLEKRSTDGDRDRTFHLRKGGQQHTLCKLGSNRQIRVICSFFFFFLSLSLLRATPVRSYGFTNNFKGSVLKVRSETSPRR